MIIELDGKSYSIERVRKRTPPPSRKYTVRQALAILEWEANGWSEAQIVEWSGLSEKYIRRLASERYRRLLGTIRKEIGGSRNQW